MDDFTACHRARIDEVKRQRNTILCGDAFVGHAQVFVGKCGVAFAVTKGKEDCFLCAVVIAIADIQTFAVFDIVRGTWERQMGGIVVPLVGERLGQFAGWIHRAIEDIGKGTTGCLPCEIRFDNRGDCVVPGHYHRCTIAEHDDDVGIDMDDGVDEFVVAVWEIHMETVEAFCFGDVGQADAQHNHIGCACDVDSLCQQIRIASIFAERISRGIRQQERISTALQKRIVQGIDGGRGDARAAGTLVARLLGKQPNESDALAWLEWQQLGGVFEEHNALTGSLTGERVMDGGIIGLRVVVRRFDLFEQRQQVPDGAVDGSGTQCAGAEGCRNARGVGVGIAGHFEIESRLECGNAVVHCSPVRDDGARVAPLGAQDIGQQPCILACECTIDAVVGAHDRPRLAFDDCLFERCEIEFTQGTFVDDGVDRHTPVFLIVGSEVLERGSNPRRLHALDIAGGEGTRQEWVFGEVFEIAAAEWRSLDVDARPEDDADPFGTCFATDCGGNCCNEFWVPATR